MRHKRPWALTLLVLALVSGCTGTVEDPIETLLIVGFTSEGRGQLALIENNVLQIDIPPLERLRWLPESVRELPGLPLAADVVDRTGERRALVVLSRNVAGISYLSIFNLQGLAPDRLEDFVETAPIALNDLPGPRPTVICPTRLQVSSTGRFAAVLNQPDACRASGDISISVLDLSLDPPRFVRHYEGLFPLVANALVLDQADDALYFLEEVGARVELRSLALDRLAELPAMIGEAEIGARDVQDMGIVLNSMVVLGSSNFAAFENYRAPGDAARLATTANSRRLISSDFADIAEVMILGRDHFTVHLSVTDTAQPPATLRDYQSGTVEALNRLVFVVGSGRVAVFDLATYAGGTLALTVIPLPDLTAPVFASWFPALVLPP